MAKVIVCPGNGGTYSESSSKIVNATNEDGSPITDQSNVTIVALVKRLGVDMVVVGPEQPLVDGVVDVLGVECEGVRVFGPSRAGAELEASKVSVFGLLLLIVMEEEDLLEFHMFWLVTK